MADEKPEVKPDGEKPDVKPEVRPDAEKPSKDASKELEKELKALKAQLKTFQDKEQAEADKQKTIEQKASELEVKLKQTERKALVAELCADKKLPRAMWSRVQGEDEESINKDIDDLLAYVKKEDSAKPESEGKGGSQQPIVGGSSDGEGQGKAQKPHVLWMEERNKRLGVQSIKTVS
jgi:hypothetical protein